MIDVSEMEFSGSFSEVNALVGEYSFVVKGI